MSIHSAALTDDAPLLPPVRSEIAFIDPGVDDVPVLLAGLRPEVEGVLLQPELPVASQMAATLRNRRNLDAIHILAHGGPGSIQYTGQHWTAESLSPDAGLASIGHALGYDGELCLWSCETGAGPAGTAFVDVLSKMTGARVRASSRIVGAAARGGSWDVDGVGTPPLTLAGLSAYAGAFNQNLQSVTVTGIADIGQVLTATPSFNGNGNQGTLTYQWRYSTNGGSTWITITGATASTFTITAAEQGYIIDVVATQSFGGGNTRTATSNPTGSVACFLAGTLIDTPKGKVPVETLVRGDDVVTSDGKVSPVQWVGRQTVSTTFADPTRVLPIRIKAGAFGDAMPERDLLVSPDHALLVDGVLVHAGALVNGLSIVREHDVPNTFTYYHVELADHSLVLAEGVPAETFIDNVDRMAFDNWAEHEALYPAGAPTMVEMDLPRAKSHRQVPRAIRERLTARAAALFGAVEQAA